LCWVGGGVGGFSPSRNSTHRKGPKYIEGCEEVDNRDISRMMSTLEEKKRSRSFIGTWLTLSSNLRTISLDGKNLGMAMRENRPAFKDPPSVLLLFDHYKSSSQRLAEEEDTEVAEGGILY